MRSLLIAAALATVVACVRPPVEAPPPPVETPPEEPLVEEPLTPAERVTAAALAELLPAVTPPGADSIHTIEAIDFSLSVSGIAGQGDVTLLLQSPDGAAYQQLRWDVDGEVDTVHTHEARVLVAGSAISSYGMSGTWTARVHVNGVELSALPMELKP